MAFALKLKELRERHGLSVQDAAKLLGVIPLTVLNWEKWMTFPSLWQIETVAKVFGVSADYLVLDGEMRGDGRLPRPDYGKLDNWENYQAGLLLEYRQSHEEGLDIEGMRGLFEEAAKLPSGDEKEKIADAVYSLVSKAPYREGYRYIEPSDKDGIRALRDGYAAELKLPSAEIMKDKLLGAVYGRICGCMLGKPVEGKMRAEIKKICEEKNNYPIRSYIKPEIFDGGYAPADDDTNYVILAQQLIEQKGADFTPYDVLALWTLSQPKNYYCTAERKAVCNFIAGYQPPQTATYKNPYREMIGAQIRTDYYGYVNPCAPAAAADMALRDASVSHIKNGIYGAMFVAAMISAAVGSPDLMVCIRTGLSVIPSTSRFYERIMKVISDYEDGVTQDEELGKILGEYDESDELDWCGTISNACIVTAALLYGGGDYDRSVCMAVDCGFDTDCNGATVGSVIGMLRGSASVGENWTLPLHGTLESAICGMNRIDIAGIAAKAFEHTEKLGYKFK